MPDLLTEITRAARAYYAQANSADLTPTDFRAWLGELPATRRAEATGRGLAASRADPDFLRHYLEWRGLRMRDFLAERLPVAAFELWQAHGEFNGDLPPHGIAR